MTAFTLPQLSISMEDGAVLAWLVEDGAEVARGEPIVEIETDKATIQVEAPVSGRIAIVAPTGAVVPVDDVLAQIDDGSGEAPVPAPGGAADEQPAAAPVVATGTATPSSDRRVVASPAARRVARELGIELAVLTGSGPGGRIVVRDVRGMQPPASVAPSSAPLGDLRAAVVASLAASWRDIPHINIVGELVADGLAEAKRRAGAAGGARVTVTDLLVLAVAQSLRDVPDLNGTVGPDLTPDRSQTVNLALAVATPSGVVAPVLRNVSALALEGIAAARARLVAAARAGSLEKRELGGATCTLSNLGGYPVDLFTPVITGPQIALIAVGRLAERPVAVDGMLAVRPRITVNAAIDHRGADGEAGGRFLAALEARLAGLPAHV